ncbi:MAG TPA: hypothetical protein VIJ78_09145 [Pseudolabrys sp.]
MGSKKQTVRKIAIQPVVITDDEANFIRCALAGRDPSLIPNRFRKDGYDPYKFLFFRLLCLFEGEPLHVGKDSDDAADEPSIRRGKNWTSAQFDFRHNIQLIDPDILGLALSRFERTRATDCAITYSEYEQLLQDAWLALSGFTRADYADLSPETQAIVHSGEFINTEFDEDDDFEFWEPVNDPRYGR